MTTNQLAGLLVDGDQAWDAWEGDPRHLIAFARAHGVLPLLAERAIGPQIHCPPALRSALLDAARQDVAGDLVRERALRDVVRALAQAGVPVLLLKGADLAYSQYARPDLRPRLDSDLLVPPEFRRIAGMVLESLGYERVPQSGGDLLMYQEPFRLRRNGVDVHLVDLHWRVMNPQRFGQTLTFDDLEAAAEDRPRLAPEARGPGVIHALVLACVHRVAHHFDSDRLIWSHDIHLLAAAMPAGAWGAFVALARERRVQRVCLRGLEAAVRTWRTSIPTPALAELGQGAADDRGDEPFLTQGTMHARRILSDLRNVGGWGRRIRLLRQHAFPPATYMRDVYAPASGSPLWWLYLSRIVRGSRRWLTRS